jgi:pimeloyl-ACP methyl ester carboxylesterase
VAHHKTLACVLAALALLAAACTGSTVAGRGTTTDSASASPPSGSSSAGSSSATLPPQPAADFSDCRDAIKVGALGLPAGRADKLSFDCARISVPLDYADPSGKTISLQLIKIHDSDNHANTGSLLINPGGPGASGVDFTLGFAAEVSDNLLSHFDLIGFDPRGVGYSSPITCLSDHQKDVINAASPNVLTPAGFARAKAIAKEVATACSDKYGSSLAQYDTVQAAKDMDQIRQAVGDTQMNYLGFSYGTELGAQYAHLFPSRVRVEVLDGAVDPNFGDIATTTRQLQGFEEAFDQFAAWCQKHDPCSSLGNPRTAVYQLVAKAAAAPIPSSAPHETRKATSNLVLTGVGEAMYSQPLWASLGQALIDAEAGDSKGLLALADAYNERSSGHYTNIAEAFTAVECNDSKVGPSDATIRATARSWNARFPMFGLDWAPGIFSCQQWQPDRTVPPLPTARTTPRKILVVGNLHDPATPYPWAKDLTNALGNAELLSWNGEGHTSYHQGSRCIDNYVDDYLIAGTLPPPNTTCPR